MRPTFTSPGQGSAPVSAISPVRPGPGRLSPPVHSGPWTPASGDGRGPRRPPPRRPGLPRSVSPTRGAGPTCRGQGGFWTAAAGPRAGAAAARSPSPRAPSVARGSGWGRAGTHAGGLRPASAARRGVARTWLSPSAPGHRYRRHFAFHSVSPPPLPPSAAGFPDVGISRRRLRGGRGLGASGCPAGPRSAPFVASRARVARLPASPSPGECIPETTLCRPYRQRSGSAPRHGHGRTTKGR